MITISEKELLTTLAKWIDLQKSPFLTEAQRSSKDNLVRLSPNGHPGSRVEVNLEKNGLMRFSCVHALFNHEDLKSVVEVRRESQQFNVLMERVKLPTYVWENKKEKRFELRWEESLNGPTEMQVLKTIFQQSLFLSSTLNAQLAWKSMRSESRALH